MTGNQYKFSGKELDTEGGLDWYYFGARYYDPKIGRFLSVDPHADSYHDLTPYHYVGNNPLVFVDPTGRDSVYFVDQAKRPQDDGSEGTTYTATIYVIQNGHLVVTYVNGGSTYPNSKSNSDNSTNYNTIDEGQYKFNNKSGHNLGKKKGLNIVNADGKRIAPGTNSKGQNITMTYVNVHSGISDKGNANSRGSKGCLTIKPSIEKDFFGNFDFSNGNTGNSSGTISISRGAIPLELLFIPGSTFNP